MGVQPGCNPLQEKINHATPTKIRCPPASPDGEADGGQAPGLLQHVMARGIERREIFKDDKDRNSLLKQRPLLLLYYFWELGNVGALRFLLSIPWKKRVETEP
ncbi:MAG: hypothetical protein H8D96_05215 [Desulfobacterales bacterium]|uniref:Uncharacterized protein n=1 Tax=Candidatus Desulfatibia vada TaxID=2841696 RepID=A0A8J6TQM0_9BACT|nr:hypothetical protein [Candidatus Desulfatibia vada]